MKTRLAVLLGLAVLALAVVQPASADEVFYYTNFGGSSSQPGSIQRVDVTTNTNTTIVGGLITPDSMIFSSPTTIIYSQTNTNTVNQVNTDGTSQAVIAHDLNFPEDIALDPLGKSVVVSDNRNNRVIRIDLTAAHTVTVLAQFNAPVRGIAYDAGGRLFVNVNDPQGPKIVQLNPLTGAVLNSLGLPLGGDGLTFDPKGGALWAAILNKSGVFQIADDLSGFSEFDCPNVNNGTVCGQYDGLEADGNGNVDLANATGGYIDRYNIGLGTFSSITAAPNIDDLAPIIGLGSPPPQTATPEPASVLLVATGVFALLLLRKIGFAKSERIS